MESNAHIVEYWKTQPEVLEACLKNSLPLTENFVKLYKEVSPTHLYLVGSGTFLYERNAGYRCDFHAVVLRT